MSRTRIATTADFRREVPAFPGRQVTSPEATRLRVPRRTSIMADVDGRVEILLSHDNGLFEIRHARIER